MSPADIIARYAEVARPVILEFFPPNSCIASTRITIEVLSRFGIKAQPVPVCFVAECRERQLAYVSGIDLKGRAHQIQHATVDAWRGHLVAVAHRHLIDASFDQCSMPDHGVPIPPFVFVVPLPDSIRPREIHAVLELVTDTGEKLKVQYFPLRDETFSEAPAWELDHLQPAIEMICRRMG